MNERASRVAGVGRKCWAILVVLAFAVTGFAATFPLPIPARPTSFPLLAPANLGAGVIAWGNNNDGQISIPTNARAMLMLTAGQIHTLGLMPDTTVVGWGQNVAGSTTIPANLTDVVSVAAGQIHSLSLRADGTVLGWGYSSNGRTNVPLAATNVVAIAAGGGHSLALKADGTIVGWGWNGYGQTEIPASATNVVAIEGGYDHSLALMADGKVVGWGGNGSGQITIPSGATNVIAIAAGEGHSLALRTDGMVLGWGRNSYGQIAIPVGATNVVSIAAGEYHSLALKADGTVLGWGRNTSGQTTIPANVTNVVSIAAGYDHSLALAKSAVSIIAHPTGQRALESNSVTLNVTATGLPLYYQWRKEGTNVPGATGSSLVLSPARVGDTGVYSVIVSNALGAVISTDAPLVILSFGAPVVRADGEEVIESVIREPSTVLTMETQFSNGYIFYTLDGSAPSFSSPLYFEPFAVSNTVVVRALALSADFSRLTEAPAATVFVRPNSLEVSSGGGGSVGVSPAQPYYATESLVTLTATSDSGWSFLRWEGDATGSSNPLELTVSHSLQVRAVFGTSILTNVLGNGRIEITPAGPAPYGSNVGLRAVPGPGQRFVVWGNAVLGTNNPTLFAVVQPNPTVAALFAAGPAGLPVISLLSSNVTVPAGQSQTLNASVTGTGPLHYQWRLNGMPITGATNAVFNLADVNEMLAGAYDLVVTGPVGSTVSEKIQVMVTLFDVRPVFSLWGGPGAGFQVDYTDEIAGGSWLALTNGVLSGKRTDVIDFSSTNRAHRFYRAVPAGAP